MPKKYHGVIPPLVTPIDENENVDEKGFRQLLKHCADNGIHGIFLAGTTGETMAITQSERDRSFKIANDEVGKRMTIMTGVMDTSTRKVIDNIKRLEQMGGTCAIVTPVFYSLHTSQNETVRHFEKIAKETNIDLCLYNIPVVTGIKLTAETMIKILKMDKVIGVKDSSGDFIGFQRVIQEFSADPKVSLLQGHPDLAAASFLHGADGYVPGAAPLFPKLFIQLYEAGTQGDLKRTLELNKLIFETSEIAGLAKSWIVSTKYSYTLLGYTHKRATWPIEDASPEEEKAIDAKYKMLKEKLEKLGLV